MEPNLASYAAWNVADYLLETGLFAKAIEFYEECFVLLRICITSGLERTIQKRPREVEKQLYMGLANAYSHTGDPKKAKEICEKCLEINKTSGIERRQSNCFEFIGRMHLYLGQCKESLAFYEKALELKKKIKDKKKVATSCCAVSSLYYNLCQYDEALNTHKRLLKSVKNIRSGNGGSHLH